MGQDGQANARPPLLASNARTAARRKARLGTAVPAWPRRSVQRCSRAAAAVSTSCIQILSGESISRAATVGV